ncbi:integrase [Streptococcus pneumoniae]|nr:integrase [Streptococcus pneumoniae]
MKPQPTFANIYASNSCSKVKSKSSRSTSISKHLERAGCPRFTFHAFRHTHATAL